ncbi:MAG: hypothetical protein A4E56_03164 [Pelotomaculum sp. PtaU1.Bin065]|nr:MAG: hypothetical protein A4E56_03164 [Pelotomaculum sp. PtaU1.Bin065]
MKKFSAFIITLALAVILLPWFHLHAEAASQVKVAKFWIGQSYYVSNDQKVDMDVSPYVSEDRTLVPLRFLAYALGVPESGVKWDDKAQTATISGNGTNLVFTIGSRNYTVNGGKKTMDTTPVINDDRTMLPARYVAEALGYDVLWNDEYETVTVVQHGRETVPFAGGTITVPEEVRVVESVMGITSKVQGTVVPTWYYDEPNYDRSQWSLQSSYIKNVKDDIELDIGIYPGIIQTYGLADVELARFRPIIAVYFPDNVDEVFNGVIRSYWAIKDKWAATLDENGNPKKAYNYVYEINNWYSPPCLKLKCSSDGIGFISIDMKTR